MGKTSVRPSIILSACEFEIAAKRVFFFYI